MGTKIVWLLSMCFLGDCASIGNGFNSEVECAYHAGLVTVVVWAEDMNNEAKRALLQGFSYTCTPSKGGA